MSNKGKVVSVLMFDRVVQERIRLARKCEEYIETIFKLGEELDKLKKKVEDKLPVTNCPLNEKYSPQSGLESVKKVEQTSEDTITKTNDIVKGMKSALEDVKHGRYHVLTKGGELPVTNCPLNKEVEDK